MPARPAMSPPPDRSPGLAFGSAVRVQFADRVRGLLRCEHDERDRGREEVRLIAMLGCPPDTLRVAILGKIRRRLKCARCRAKEPQLVASAGLNIPLSYSRADVPYPCR